MLVLKAAMTLAKAKMMTDNRRAGLRPQMSLLLVQIGPAAALASR
jgi:hypothetical protein